MKKIILLIIILLIFTISKSQDSLSYGIVPKKSILAGFETGGSYMVVQPEYSITGEKMRFFDLRSVPKIAYAPINNFLFGLYFEHEFLNIDGKRDQTINGYGAFLRSYLPFFNRLTKLNNNNYFKDRLFFFSEVYLGKSNIILLENGDTGSSSGYDTMFYGVKLGTDFRLFNKMFFEIAVVQNFDNRNGDFKSFHPELGFEYIFNILKKNE